MCCKTLWKVLGVSIFIAGIGGAASAADTVYHQWDFEATSGSFSTPDPPGGWEWGTPVYPAGLSAHSGTKLWGTNLSGQVDDYSQVYELNIAAALPASPDAGVFLRWWDWYGAETADVKSVYVDDGGLLPTLVWSDADTDQRFWQRRQADISQWAGTSILITFQLSTCCSGPGPDGWYIDDVSIEGGAYPLWDFEADDGGFVLAKGDWEWGIPTYPVELTAAHSGLRLWGTKLDGPALEGGGVFVDHDLRREIGVHPDGSVLSWWDWNKAEDLVDIRSVSVDDGFLETELMSDKGNQYEWRIHHIDLSPWAGQRVSIVFRLSGCCTAPGPDGWYIDDAQILPIGIFADGFESGGVLRWSSSGP